jgi:hypothetical protein
VTLPSSNAEFLAAIFGPLPGANRPMVCGFEGNPDDKPGPPGRWAGWPWMPEIPADAPGLNWYFTLAVYEPAEGSRYVRQRINCRALHGVMLDDIGTTVQHERLHALPPSVLVETSKGNHQALYLFEQPITDTDEAHDLQDALIAAGLCDPGAHGPSTRWCRLPFAVNGKTAPAFNCRLVGWRPTQRYTVEQIRAAFALPAPKPREKHSADPHDTRAEWEALDEATRAERLATVESALQAIPSDDHGLWVRLGHCMRASFPDPIAYPMFERWSRKSSRFTDEGLERFRTFKPQRAGYQAILAHAQDVCGWKNPRQRVELDPYVVFGQSPVSAPLPVPLPPALPPPPFVEVSIDDLESNPPEPQVWWWDNYLPAGHVTLLGGHGGAGKSTLGFMLAASIAAGLPFLGIPTRRGRVLYFSAEDPGSLVRRRVAKVCREFEIAPAALAPTLRVLDVTDGAPALFTEQRQQGVRAGVLTATYEALAQYVRANAIDVVVVDNASDTYDGDEINRASVRQFVRSLALLVRPRNGAVLLLAHVDKATSRAGSTANTESYSGSTAWHNTARSRLFFRASSEPGMYELQLQKHNLGKPQPPLFLTWPEDRLPRVCDAMTAPREPDDDLRDLLRVIDEAAAAGHYPSTAPQGRPTMQSIIKERRAIGTRLRNLTAAALGDMLADAVRRKLLLREIYAPSRGKNKERYLLTPEGLQFIGVATSATSATSGLSALA